MRLRDFGTQSCFSSFISDLTYSMTQMMLRLLYKSAQSTQIILYHCVHCVPAPLCYLFTNTLKNPLHNSCYMYKVKKVCNHRRASKQTRFWSLTLAFTPQLTCGLLCSKYGFSNPGLLPHQAKQMFDSSVA